MKRWLVLLAAWAGCAIADEMVQVCFNYGCQRQELVMYSDSRLDWARMLLAAAATPEQEREFISLVVGQLYGWAAEQTPIGADRGGNLADEGRQGSMDCIDHSTTTNRFLRMLEAHGWLRFHRVLDPALRRRFVFQEHWSAVIEEKNADGRYVVDSWFVSNGKPAVVLPFAEWLDGGGTVVE
jgi:hypothetical protein